MSSLQLFPALEPATEAALRASIQRFGVLVPVVQDQNGRTLDGTHRQRLADELGVKYRVDVIRVADEQEAEAIVVTLNTDRGHRLKSDQRREVVADLREQGHSTPAIAGALGVSDETVRRDLAGSTYVEPERVTGRDGKSYSSRRPTVVAAKNAKEAVRAITALSLVGTVPSVPVVDVRRVERIAREQEAERKRQEPCETRTVVDDLDIRHGQFWEALADVPDGTVDAIVTDPPYGVGGNGIRTLYAESLRLLRPGGALVCMIGQLDVPAYLEQYADLERQELWGLDYRWICAWLTPGPATRIYAARVGTNWKPVLVFERLDMEDGELDQRWILGDVFQSPADDKEHHHWGQNLTGFRDLVEAFTQPGDLVCDPYLGGGTTAVACRDLGRRFVGCDIDPAAVATARERLA